MCCLVCVVSVTCQFLRNLANIILKNIHAVLCGDIDRATIDRTSFYKARTALCPKVVRGS